MSKMAVPNKYTNKSPRQRQILLKWMDIENEIQRATNLHTFKILNSKEPNELQDLMPMNTNSQRIREHRKLATKPKWLSKNKLAPSTYRARAYNYNKLPKAITQLTDPKKFKKELKKHLQTKMYSETN